MPGSDPDATQNTTAAPERVTSASRASVPPSEPRSSRASLSAIDSQIDSPARLQMIVALILGLVLVAIPLYLWRRPRAESIAVSRALGDGGSLSTSVMSPPSSEPSTSVTLSEPRVLSCHDPGPKKTPPDRCDHLPELERSLAKAIEDSASCLSVGGTIQYVADVSFKRKTIGVTTPKDGRTIKSAKLAGGCASAVKGKLSVVALDRMPHEHARYKISITATYPGPAK